MQYADACCKCEEKFEPRHTYTFTGPYLDPADGFHSVTVLAPDLYKYRRGAMIQEAFPYLSSSDREFLMSGISDKAWAETFAEEE